MVEGVYGQGIAELIRKGFDQGLEAVGGGNTVVLAASGGWNRADGLRVTQDFLASDKEFGVIYAMNEEMMAGAIQAIEEAGKEVNYALFSANGKEIGWEWMREGIMEGSVANPPTLEADLIYQMVQAHIDGKTYPRHVYNLQPMLTVENIDGAVPWDIDSYVAMRESGELKVDLLDQPEITSMVSWNPAGSN